jgi:hypothetical protein
MIRAMNPVTSVSPFASVNCADLGDVPPNPVDIQDSLNRVTEFISVMKKKKHCSNDGWWRSFGYTPYSTRIGN